MNEITIIAILGISLLFSIVFLFFYIFKPKKNEKQFPTIDNNDELRNCQIEILQLNRSELELKNSYEGKLSELKLNYEKQLNEQSLSFEKEKNVLKDNFRKEKDQEYRKGYDIGVKSANISVHVMPYKEVTKDDGIIFKEDIVLIGYKYQLFSNGIPCLDAHLEITERMHVKEIKEENVKFIVAKIEEIISKIPNPNIQMIGNMKDFGKGIIDLKKSKK